MTLEEVVAHLAAAIAARRRSLARGRAVTRSLSPLRRKFLRGVRLIY